MGKRLQNSLLVTILSALLLAALLAGCGSSSSDPPTSGSTAASTKSGAGNGNPLSLGGPQGASSFIKPKNPNDKYARFGKEASTAEREAASKVLAENLEAREAANFATQCATLSVKANEEITEVKKPAEAKSLCAGALKKLATPLKKTEEFRVDNFRGLIAALRVKGKTAYALYHGNDGKDWMMPMLKEGSIWRASSISTTEVP